MPNAHYVYLAKRGEEYKIGRSTAPDRRMRSFNTRTDKAELIHTISTLEGSGLEHRLHLRYAEHRARGEWFILPEEAVKEILALRDEVPPPPIPDRVPFARTPLMTLIEGKDPAGRHFRAVVIEMWERLHHVEGVAGELGAMTGHPVTGTTVRNWLDEWGIEWRSRPRNRREEPTDAD